MKTIRKTIPLMVATATAASTVLGLLALHSPAAATETSRTGPSACRGMGQIAVPGAERLEAACLTDLTTAGTTQTGHTNPEDGAGLSVPGTVNPTGVPGIQLDGYFPDTSTFNTNNGWNHDSQFVIRMPESWNGGLVVAGPPGVRRQYAADGPPQAHQALLGAGFPRGSEPIWEFTYRNFWDPIQRTLREEIDPTYDGDVLGGHPFCSPGTAQCDADHDLATRPSEVRDAIADISLTGRIKRPLITLQGTLDTAVTPRHSRLYASMIADQRRSSMARLYEIEGGSHFEALYGRHPGLLTPILPCFREAFADLEQWTKHDKAPARSHYVPRDPASDLLNTCAL